MAEDGFDREMTPSLKWRLSVLAGVLGAFVVVDQATKYLVRSLLVDGAWSMPSLPGFMRFEFVANRGASFGMGEGFGFAFAVLAIAVVLGIGWYVRTAKVMSKVELVGLAMVAGGAIGNMIDRLSNGFVTDFFCTEFISFPVFNVADIGITCGVAIALIGFLFLSPANKVDATAELNRRDAEERARREAKRASRDAKTKNARKKGGR